MRAWMTRLVAGVVFTTVIGAGITQTIIVERERWAQADAVSAQHEADAARYRAEADRYIAHSESRSDSRPPEVSQTPRPPSQGQHVTTHGDGRSYYALPIK